MSDGPALTLYKADSDPSWRDTAASYAAPWGLVDEVLDDYDKAIARGDTPAQAAWVACLEWDVTPIGDDPPGSSQADLFP